MPIFLKFAPTFPTCVGKNLDVFILYKIETENEHLMNPWHAYVIA